MGLTDQIRTGVPIFPGGFPAVSRGICWPVSQISREIHRLPFLGNFISREMRNYPGNFPPTCQISWPGGLRSVRPILVGAYKFPGRGALSPYAPSGAQLHPHIYPRARINAIPPHW